MTAPVAVVTGGNRGIGLEVVRQLAGRGYVTVLGARDPDAGGRAARGLEGSVVVRRLDVTEPSTVTELADWLTAQHGGLDVLVNNAAVHYDLGQGADNADLAMAEEAMAVNVLGAWRTAVRLGPLIRPGGRIVNVSSGMGALNDMGGGSSAYRVSKTSLNALTRILASELRGTGILVNSVCPGWVQTDMGGSGASRAIEEGADTPVWAATLPNNGPTGGFFRDRRQVPW